MKAFYILTILFMVAAVGTAADNGVPLSSNAPVASIKLTPDFLGELTAEMRSNSPALKASFARTNAASAAANAVPTWEDPMARMGGVGAREEMRADEGDILYGVDQKLPLFGKPGLARRVARAELATETASAEYQFQLQRSELAKAAFATALADRVVAIGEQDLDWLATTAQAMDSKYRAGQATLIEVLQIQNESARRTTQLQTDRDQLVQEQVSLNRLLNRDLLSPWPRLELPELPGAIAYNERLLGFARQNEPKIRMMQQQVNQAEAVAALTRRQRFPDVSLGLEGRNYSGDGSFRQGMVVFSMSVPWVNPGKYRNDIRRDDAKVKAAEFELADYELSVREEVHRLTTKINSAHREALLYRDQIIPRTESALESARAGWEAAQGTIRDVLEARRMLLEGRLMYARALTEQYQMMSELVLCCGLGDLNALSMISAEPETSRTAGTDRK